MRIIPLGNRQEPDGVGLFFEVDDESLARIESDPEYYLDRKFVNSCFKQKGNNVHLYLLVNNGDVARLFRKFKFLLDQYDTVSWWTRKHVKFYLRRKRHA